MGRDVFVFEFITGGGLLGSGEMPTGSLLHEGRAMLAAIAADLVRANAGSVGCGSGDSALSTNSCPHAANPGRVSILWDGRLPRPAWQGVEVHAAHSGREVRQRFRQRAAEAAWTLVIAPEFDQYLEDYCQQVCDAGGRRLSGPLEWVRHMADKQAAADWLAARGIQVPRGVAIGPGDTWPPEIKPPAVLKPRHGAGSLEVQRIDPHELTAAMQAATSINGEGETGLPIDTADRPWRLESFVPGVPASVSVLGSPAGSLVLPPMQQMLAGTPGLRYEGGRWPLPVQLRRRAMQLAARVAQAAVGTFNRGLGYYGIDLVLGSAADGSQDAVIEVNPRLTTSYVGLRAAARFNLAAVMLCLAEGASFAELIAKMGPLVFDALPLEFLAAGAIRRDVNAEHASDLPPIEPLWIPIHEAVSTLRLATEAGR